MTSRVTRLVCTAHALGLNAVTPPSKHKAFNQCCLNVGQRRRRWPNIETYWVNASCLLGGLHHISTDLWKYDAVFPPVQKTQGSTSSCICIPGSVSMQIESGLLLCLYNILPPISVYVKSETSSSWGISFFC